jgi:hypothetical protein
MVELVRGRCMGEVREKVGEGSGGEELGVVKN